MVGNFGDGVMEGRRLGEGGGKEAMNGGGKIACAMLSSCQSLTDTVRSSFVFDRVYPHEKFNVDVNGENEGRRGLDGLYLREGREGKGCWGLGWGFS